ncbi:MAG TPA: hypothetical protein VFV19_01135 [Candidatus Polarisedimenticolaceae bacterium]|nr:hypothetical protein [Candidatus Polarisedimenticolaceae bacterium]
MSRSITTATLLIATLPLLAGRAYAAPAPKREEIKLDRTATVGAAIVPPGTYRVEIASDLTTATLFQGKRPVATAPVHVGLGEVIYPGNALHFRPEAGGADRLVKIVFGDSRVSLDFNPAVPEKADAGIAGPVATH